jgi:uncharacterized protein (DUF1697 family)
MTKFFALLRAINTGSDRTLKMQTLCQVFVSLGFSGVETFIASGNVIFETTVGSTQALESKIEQGLQETLGHAVPIFIRTEAEFVQLANYQPFPQSEIETAGEFNLIFLSEPLNERYKQAVLALCSDTDEFRVHEREIYWLRHKNKGGATFSTVPLQRVLTTLFTIRTVNTVKRMAVKYTSSK